MRILLEEYETASHKICLFQMEGRTAAKFGLTALWEVRTYKTGGILTPVWNYLVGGTLEGTKTTHDRALQLFQEVCDILIKKEVGDAR